MSELATQFNLHPNQIKQWKGQLLDGVSDAFDDKPRASVSSCGAKNRSIRPNSPLDT